MPIDKVEAVALLVQDAFPLLTVSLQQDARRIVGKNGGGPLAHPINICELCAHRHEALWDILSSEDPLAHDEDETEILCQTPHMTLTYHQRDVIIRYFAEAHQYRLVVLELSDEMFDQFYRDYYEREKSRKSALSLLSDRSAFFSMPDANAQYDFWLAVPAWKLAEAASLSLGKDPRVVNLASLESQSAEESGFVKTFKARMLIFERAVEIGELPILLRIRPFVDWCNSHKISLPERLSLIREADATRDEQLQEIQNLKSRLRSFEEGINAINPKSKRTFSLMLIVMAIDGYTHKLTGNSTAISQIVEAFDRYGLSINNTTVKEALRAVTEDIALADEIDSIRKATTR